MTFALQCFQSLFTAPQELEEEREEGSDKNDAESDMATEEEEKAGDDGGGGVAENEAPVNEETEKQKVRFLSYCLLLRTTNIVQSVVFGRPEFCYCCFERSIYRVWKYTPAENRDFIDGAWSRFFRISASQARCLKALDSPNKAIYFLFAVSPGKKKPKQVEKWQKWEKYQLGNGVDNSFLNFRKFLAKPQIFKSRLTSSRLNYITSNDHKRVFF